MECSAEHVCHLHLLMESVTKKCDKQTCAGQKKKESPSTYHATQGDTKSKVMKSGCKLSKGHNWFKHCQMWVTGKLIIFASPLGSEENDNVSQNFSQLLLKNKQAVKYQRAVAQSNYFGSEKTDNWWTELLGKGCFVYSKIHLWLSKPTRDVRKVLRQRPFNTVPLTNRYQT